MKMLIALLILTAPVSADEFRWAVSDGPGFSWAVTERGGDPQSVDMTVAQDAQPGADVSIPSAPVSDYVHRIDVNNGRGSCEYIGDRTVVTAGHLFRGLERNSMPVIKIDGEQYAGQWGVSTAGDAAVVVLNRDPGWKAASYERRRIVAGEPLTIFGQKTGLHRATGTDRSYTTKELALDVESPSQQGDSGGGVFDADGDLVAIHGGSFDADETICTPLWVLWTPYAPFNERPDFESAASGQSQWLDGFTGIYLGTAPWCGPCQTAHKNTVPQLESAGWTVKDMDADTEKAFIAAFNIQSLPTWIVVRNGVVIARTTGTALPTTESPGVSSALAVDDGAPTPLSEIEKALSAMPKPQVGFVEPGCGSDARWAIAAAERWGVPAVGIEIDPARASAARERVANLGLDGLVTIVNGDARDVDWGNADVGGSYLYPELLADLATKIERLDAFASYLHQPTVATTKTGNLYLYRRQQVATAVPRQQIGVWYNGYWYTSIGNCTCPMCNYIRNELAKQRAAAGL